MAAERETWEAVDRYLEGVLPLADDALEGALEASAAAGLPAIQVSPAQGRLLQLLALSVGARRVLEIGTLGGYSAIWLGRALPPDGRLVTLELEPRHAEVARQSLRRAGLADLALLRVGSAADSLAALEAEGAPPFDLIFIDADKAGIPSYFAHALRLSRRGSLIVVDNVVRGGAVADPQSTDASVLGVRRFLEAAAAEPRVTITVIQTVGVKGHDGFALVRVGEPGESHGPRLTRNASS